MMVCALITGNGEYADPAGRFNRMFIIATGNVVNSLSNEETRMTFSKDNMDTIANHMHHNRYINVSKGII
jgi:hypothetical protein